MAKEKFLTNRQREFCKLVCEGIYSNAECARRAGYAEGQANKTTKIKIPKATVKPDKKVLNLFFWMV